MNLSTIYLFISEIKPVCASMRLLVNHFDNNITFYLICVTEGNLCPRIAASTTHSSIVIQNNNGYV